MSPKILPAILFVAFALRAVAVMMLGDKDPSPDAINDYLPMASNFIAGKGFLNGAGEPDSVRGPGFSLFVAAIQTVFPFGGTKPIQWAQALLDTATAALIAGIASRSIGPAAGMIAVLLYAFNPMAIYACPLIGPEVQFAFLLTAAVAAYMQGIERNLQSNGWYAGWMALAGICLGFAVLTRATPVLLVPVWCVWIIARQLGRSSEGHRYLAQTSLADALHDSWSSRFRRGMIAAVILGAASAGTVLPWTYRNWVVFHEFIPVAANGGVNFYSGSSERFWPAPPEHHRQRALRREELIKLGAVPAAELPKSPGAGDKYQFTLGMANYRLAWNDDPMGLIVYLIRKSFRLWYATQSGRMEVFVGTVNLTWLALATIGITIAIRSRRGAELMPCLLTIAYFPVVLIGMFPLARYVVAFTPCLCILASATFLPLLITEPQPLASQAIRRRRYARRTKVGFRSILAAVGNTFRTTFWQTPSRRTQQNYTGQVIVEQHHEESLVPAESQDPVH